MPRIEASILESERSKQFGKEKKDSATLDDGKTGKLGEFKIAKNKP